MTNKKRFLYSNRGKILPNKIEIGEVLINEFNKKEKIYFINKQDPNLTFFKTNEKVYDEIGIKRGYSIKNNYPNSLKKITQKLYEIQSPIINTPQKTIPKNYPMQKNNLIKFIQKKENINLEAQLN